MANDWSSEVQWGIIGCGQIAHDKAVPAIELAENAQLVAFSDPDEARLDQMRQGTPEARAYAETRDLLEDEAVQAVYIGTPNFMHAEQTIAAVRAGKHVLVEKPMCMNAAEARDMVAAAEAAGVKLMVAYMALFNPVYEMAKQIVDGGRLGDIMFVRARHAYPMNPDRLSDASRWRLDREQGGGPLMDVALYSANAVRSLLGQRIKSLSATGTTRRLHGLTDYDTLVFSFLLEDGTPGVIEGSFTYTASTVELEGTRGLLSLERHITQAIEGRLDVALRFPGQRGVSERITHEIDPSKLPHFYNYWREVEHFSHCILTDQEPLPSGRRVVAEMMVADAVRESLKSGQRVELSF